jgi:hypothetical protein
MNAMTIYHAGALFFRIEGWPRYYVSRCGQVLSTLGSPHVLHPTPQTKGYLQLGFPVHGGKMKRYMVHRLVAERFLPQIPGKDQVNHKDGNQINNHVNNLEWVTNRENYRHAQEMRFKRTGQRRFPFW